MRIGTLLCILIFLLVPLMSSPVAAIVVSNSSATAGVSDQGPLATVWVPGSPENNDDDTSGWMRFDCAYSFADTKSTPNSEYWAQITVWLVEGEDRTLVDSQDVSFYAPGPPPGLATTASGTLSVLTQYYSVPTDWEIIVESYCKDLYTQQEDYDWAGYNANVI